jgi:hypothetical protein
MMAILVLAFTGVVALLHLDGIAPRPDDTVLSQLARHVFGGGALYGGVQLVTVMILLFGANTSYNDFPRLLYLMARDSYAPHAFLRMGDRLAFSNGVIFLTLASLLVYLAFSGNLQPLIPLFAVGVFLAFTLSQAGMVRRWWTRRGRGWRSSLALNAAGAVLSAVVLVTAATTKLLEGAWVVVLGVPVVVVLCLRIRAHYDAVREALRLRVDEDEPELEPGDVAAPTETPASRRPPAAAETQDVPDQLRHLVLVPVSRLDLANLRALSYAASLRKPLLALHISPGTEEAERFSEEWRVWGGHLPVVVVISPYRALLPPLITYIQALHRQAEDVTITVAVPEMVVHRAWHRLLHNQVVSRLRRALRRERGVVVTSVPVHLPAT